MNSHLMPNVHILSVPLDGLRFEKKGHHMFQTKTLLVIIFILGSAVAVKAGVFYTLGLPDTEYVLDLTALP
jgi:hypothetical protein